MGTASGSAADGEASGAGKTSGSGGGFELNSVTPTAIKNDILRGANVGGIFGSNIFPERSAVNWTALALAGAGAMIGAALWLSKRRGS